MPAELFEEMDFWSFGISLQ